MSTFGTGSAMPGAMAPTALTFGGFWIRLVAYIIDAVILTVVNWLLLSSFVAGMGANIDPSNIQMGPVVAMACAYVLIPAIYVIGFWTAAGATPGKMLFRLRVVRSDNGGPISLGQAIGRFFGYVVSSLVFGLGFLWIAFDGRKQGWHDKLAGTVVVHRGPDAVRFSA